MIKTESFYDTPAPAGLTGIKAWLLTHDHKRLGLMYMWAILFWFVIAMFFGLLLRTELMSQGRTIMGPEVYNSLFTLHGVIMIFLFVIPAIPAIFGNFFFPSDSAGYRRCVLSSFESFQLVSVHVWGSFCPYFSFQRGWVPGYGMDILCAF